MVVLCVVAVFLYVLGRKRLSKRRVAVHEEENEKAPKAVIEIPQNESVSDDIIPQREAPRNDGVPSHDQLQPIDDGSDSESNSEEMYGDVRPTADNTRTREVSDRGYAEILQQVQLVLDDENQTTSGNTRTAGNGESESEDSSED